MLLGFIVATLPEQEVRLEVFEVPTVDAVFSYLRFCDSSRAASSV